MGKGISIRAIEEAPPTPVPIRGIGDWLKKYAPWLVGIGVVGGVIYASVKIKKKR